MGFYCNVLATVIAFVLCQGTVTMGDSCEPLTSQAAKNFCGEFGYNMTASHIYRTQDEAAALLTHFKPLKQVLCSPNVAIFLCSVFFPMCYSSKAIPPCRSVCLQVKSDCSPLMKRFGYAWPTHLLNCSTFPEYGNGEMCVSQNASSTTNSTRNSVVTTAKPTPTVSPQVIMTKKRRPVITLKQRQKRCWKNGNRDERRCCRFGKKIVKMSSKNTCSLQDNLMAKRGKQRKILRTAKKYCNLSTMDRLCYRSCCLYSIKRKRQQRRNRKGKNKRRS